MSRRTIAVTGAAGFIGWNLVRALSERGEVDVLAVDLSNGGDPAHLDDSAIAEVIAPDEFMARLAEGRISVAGVLHQGAITDTECDDEALLQRLNVDYTVRLAGLAAAADIPLVYASSASVYGASPITDEANEELTPLNPYARSKAQIDRLLRPLLHEAAFASTLVGLRYFNVYGPGEGHKGAMASIIHQAHHQLRNTGEIRLFEGEGGEPAGSQRRDWVHIDDVVRVNLHFLDQATPVRGVFNVGTGHAPSFAEVATAVIDAHGGSGRIQPIAFPDHLRGRYQPLTCADLGALRRAGYTAPFIEACSRDGVAAYVNAMAAR